MGALPLSFPHLWSLLIHASDIKCFGLTICITFRNGVHKDKAKQSVCSKRASEGGNSAALEFVGNINTSVSFLGGPCVSKNFHYKSMHSNFRSIMFNSV